MTDPLWLPSVERIASANVTRFMRFLGEREGVEFDGHDALHRFSVGEPGIFWSALWDFCGVIGDKGQHLMLALDEMPGARFFPDVVHGREIKNQEALANPEALELFRNIPDLQQ